MEHGLISPSVCPAHFLNDHRGHYDVSVTDSTGLGTDWPRRFEIDEVLSPPLPPRRPRHAEFGMMPICHLPPSLQLSRHFILVNPSRPSQQPSEPHIEGGGNGGARNNCAWSRATRRHAVAQATIAAPSRPAYLCAALCAPSRLIFRTSILNNDIIDCLIDPYLLCAKNTVSLQLSSLMEELSNPTTHLNIRESTFR